MKDRIKKLRKSLGLTQQEFGDRVGIKRAAISLIESGTNNPSDQTILAICREFRVREDWLRTGDGSMQEPISRKEEITRFFDECSSLPDDDFRKIIVEYLAATDAKGWALLESELRRFAALLPAGEPKDTDQISLFTPSQPPEASQSAPAGEGVKKPPETDTSGLTASQEAELAEIARQMRLETEAAEKSYHSSAG